MDPGDTANNSRDKQASYLSKLPILTKVIELVFGIFCIGLLVDPYNHGQVKNLNRVTIVYVAYCSYIIINTILLISYATKDQLPKRTLVLFSLVGGILFLTAGAVVLDDWTWQRSRIILIKSKQYMDMTVASGVFAIFNAFVFFADLFLTIAYT